MRIHDPSLHPLRAVDRSWSWTSPKHLARRHRYWRLDSSLRDTPDTVWKGWTLKSSSSSVSRLFRMELRIRYIQSIKQHQTQFSPNSISHMWKQAEHQLGLWSTKKKAGDSVFWSPWWPGEKPKHRSPAARCSPAPGIFQGKQHLLCWCPAGRGRHWPRHRDAVLSLVVNPSSVAGVRPT